jgi:hypothetical protein
MSFFSFAPRHSVADIDSSFKRKKRSFGGLLSMPPALQHFDGVGQEVQDNLQGFSDALGAAGQVDNQRAIANSGSCTGENGIFRLLPPAEADYFAQAGNQSVTDRLGGFGRNIAGSKTGTAGGKHYIGLGLVGEKPKLGSNGIFVIRYDSSPADLEVRVS